jgi:hypothetical protein
MEEQQRDSRIRIDATLQNARKTEELKPDEEGQKKTKKKEEILEENEKKEKMEGLSEYRPKLSF